MYCFLPFYFCGVLLKLPCMYSKNTSLVLHLGKHTYQENYISPDRKVFWSPEIYFTHISPASDHLWWLYREEAEDRESSNDHSMKKTTFRPEIILSDFKGTNLKLIKNISAHRKALPSGHTPFPVHINAYRNAFPSGHTPFPIHVIDANRNAIPSSHCICSPVHTIK